MQLNFWEDDVSRALAKRGGLSSTAWKISNLTGKGSFFLLLGAIFLVIFVIVLPAIFGSSGVLANFLINVIPIISMLMIIAAGISFLVFVISIAIMAFSQHDTLWGIAILVLSVVTGLGFILALFYKRQKSKEILGAKPPAIN